MQLLSPERKAIAELTSEMWTEYDGRIEVISLDQDTRDVKLFTGETAPQVWLENLRDLQFERSTVLPQLRGTRREVNPTTRSVDEIKTNQTRFTEVPVSREDFEAIAKRFGDDDIIRLVHPVREALETYFSFTPRDDDGDGQLEFAGMQRAREAFLQILPDEIRGPMLEQLDKNLSEAEKAMRELSRGVLGQYWQVDDVIAEENNLQQLLIDVRTANSFDPDLAKVLRAQPAFKAFNRLVEQRKEFMRQTIPVLDYSLNALGFTGGTRKFKNLQAKLWWVEDDNKPVLSRIFDNLE